MRASAIRSSAGASTSAVVVRVCHSRSRSAAARYSTFLKPWSKRAVALDSFFTSAAGMGWPVFQWRA